MTSKFPVHLLVVCHGLWGNRDHISYMCATAEKYAQQDPLPVVDVSTPRPKLVVLQPYMNEFTNTYDGIDICSERVVEEIDEEISKIEDDGGRVTKFSIVGYSLGGLIARYALGVLGSRSPNFFDAVEPVNFTTFASPAIGMPRYKTFWSSFTTFLGSRLLSRTGAQLFGKDRFLPYSFKNGTGSTTNSGSATPTKAFGCCNSVKLDSSEQTKSHSSVLQKQRIKETRAWFRKKEKADTLLAVLADPRYSFYKTLKRFKNISIYANTVGDRTVPFPTGGISVTDPFAKALKKTRRDLVAQKLDPDSVILDVRDGGLDLKLDESGVLIESYDEKFTSSKTRANGPTPKPLPLIRVPLLMRPSTYPFSRTVSWALVIFLPVALPLFVGYLVIKSSSFGRSSRKRIIEIRDKWGYGRAGTLGRVGLGISDSSEEAEDIVFPTLKELADEDEADATQPVLTESQLLMIHHLNALPQLKKYYAYFPEVRNSHGTIIVRDPSISAHHAGKGVVKHWAKHFEL